MTFRNSHQHVDQIIESYKSYIVDYEDDEVTAAVKSGYMDVLIKNKEKIQATQQARIRNFDETLLDVAFYHGQVEVIEYLLNQRNDDLDLLDKDKILRLLFARNLNSKKPTEVLDAMTKIFSERFEDIRSDLFSEVISVIAVQCAENNNLTALQYLIENNLITNINCINPKNGHGILYYLTNSNKASQLQNTESEEGQQREQLRRKLVDQGAVLNDQDIISKKQLSLTSNIINAMKEMKFDYAIELIKQVEENPGLLAPDMLRECLGYAIEKDYVSCVAALLNCNGLILNQDFLRDEFKSVHSLESANLLLSYMASHPLSIERDNRIDSIFKNVGHRVGLSGEIVAEADGSRFSSKLEGGSPLESQRMLINSLIRLGDDKPAWASEVEEALRFNFYANHIENVDIKTQILMNHYNAGKLIMASPRWFGHCLGMAVRYDPATRKSYLSLSNRGDGNLEACVSTGSKYLDQIKAMLKGNEHGTIIYELDGVASVELMKFMMIHDTYTSFEPEKTREAFKEIVDQFLIDAKPLTILKAGAQSRGTCSFVNPKRSLEGAMFINRLCRGEELLMIPQDEIYNEYKRFSLSDKRAACEELINFHREFNSSRSVPRGEQLDALNQLISLVIMTHHELKQGGDTRELVMANRLFAVLSNEYKQKLLGLIEIGVIPREIATGKIESSREYSPYFFSRQQISDKQHKVLITGRVNEIIEHQQCLKDLLDYFRENNITTKDVYKINVENGKIKVFTKGDREFKEHLRDNICKKGLGAKIENVSGQYEFYITNPKQLHFTHAPRPGSSL